MIVSHENRERIYITLESELLVTSALAEQSLTAVERYGRVEASLRELVGRMQRDEACRDETECLVDDEQAVADADVMAVEREIAQLLLLLGLNGDDDYTSSVSEERGSSSWRRSREELAVSFQRAQDGLSFYSYGVQLTGQDAQLMGSMLTRAVLQGYTLRETEVKLLRRITKDMFTLVPFIVILIIPLSPLGHVLVFSFIQRFFPNFFPSQFTESRQNLMSMYSSITSSSESSAADPSTSSAEELWACALGEDERCVLNDEDRGREAE